MNLQTEMEKSVSELFAVEAERLGLDVKKILFKHEGKRRVTAVAEKKDCGLCVIKWNDPTNLAHLEKLQKEIAYYREHQSSGYIMPLVYEESNILIIKYFESVTLRKWLIEYRDRRAASNSPDCVQESFKSCISSVICAVRQLYSTPLGNEDAGTEETVKLMAKRFRGITFSWPMDAAYRSGLEIRIAWILFSLFIPAAMHKIALEVQKSPGGGKTYRLHGDLHLNNILISPDGGDAKIIDWENITSGSIFFDIVYSYSFILYLLDGLPNHQSVVRDSYKLFLKESFPQLEDTFFGLAKLLQASLSVNRAFGYRVSVAKLFVNFCAYPFRVLDSMFIDGFRLIFISRKKRQKIIASIPSDDTDAI